ncbi:MAG: phosphoglycerate kinase [Candidatus Puniceispirillales bacterium]
MSQLPLTLKPDTMRGKTVLFRADLNVPMQDGKVTDTTRIERITDSITALADHGAKVIVLSHYGRPKGKIVPEMSLAPVAEALSVALRRPVRFIADVIGVEASKAKAELNDGDIIMLENLRFEAGEEANDSDFARTLAKGVDIYVNDAFSCSHRAHASTEAITAFLPSYAGALMMAELSALDQALGQPRRPVAAIVGGAKVSTKLDLLRNLITKVDMLIVGGGMANTFLLAEGHDIGSSLVESDMIDTANAIRKEAAAIGCRFILPQDGVVATAFATHAPNHLVHFSDGHMAENEMILDAGHDAVATISAAIDECQTLIWNGPMGAFEMEPFDQATTALARHVAKRTDEGALISVAGGGDTIAALNHAQVLNHFSYVSTAGGAFLEWLEGRTLPGVAALMAQS